MQIVFMFDIYRNCTDYRSLECSETQARMLWSECSVVISVKTKIKNKFKYSYKVTIFCSKTKEFQPSWYTFHYFHNASQFQQVNFPLCIIWALNDSLCKMAEVTRSNIIDHIYIIDQDQIYSNANDIIRKLTQFY